MGIGFMLSFAASPPVAERIGLPSFYFVEKHATFLLPSIGVMIGLSFLSPRQVRRAAVIILVASILMMVLALRSRARAAGSISAASACSHRNS